jgi:hypothetical protein
MHPTALNYPRAKVRGNPFSHNLGPKIPRPIPLLPVSQTLRGNFSPQATNGQSWVKSRSHFISLRKVFFGGPIR